MKRKITAILTAAAMFLSIAAVCPSDGYFIPGDSVVVSAAPIEYNNGSVNISEDGNYFIVGDGTVTNNTIFVAAGVNANITLNNVNISGINEAAFKIEDNSTGNVTIDLEGENTLVGGSDAAGLQKNGSGASVGTLTIKSSSGTGKLTATGGSCGAGIGGGYYGNGSNITISGGTVTATGNNGGAGIGGGYYGNGSNIIISGGTVTATAADFGGAGIGGGLDGNGSNISISGGTVTATGGFCGAGIGGGLDGNGSNISISGGTVTATGNDGGAGIGGGYDGNGSNISISGGTVTATGNNGGAGIGGGIDGNGSNIFISGGSVKPQGGSAYFNGNTYYGADIGSGVSASSGNHENGVPVTPKNSEGIEVYRVIVSNPDSKPVIIDSTAYLPVNHTSVDPNDTKLYAYLTEGKHIVMIGKAHYSINVSSTDRNIISGQGTPCSADTSNWLNNENGHWHGCAVEAGCTTQYDYAGHTYSWKTDAGGTREYSCDVCGYKPNAPHTHTPDGDLRYNADEHWHICSDCANEYDKEEHTLIETVIREATEDNEGEKEISCQLCGYSDTVTIPRLTHTHTESISYRSDETGHWHYCTKCGEKSGDTEKHTFDEGVITKEPTEYEDGVKTFTCQVCGYQYTEAIEKLAHTHKPSTEYKSDEKQHWHYCTECGEKLDCADHIPDGGKVTRQATSYREGEITYSCTVCGKVLKKEIIPMKVDPVVTNAFPCSYIYSYDSSMNKITVNKTKKSGVITVKLGKKYAGKSFTLYEGKNGTKVKFAEGTLDENGCITINVENGKNYTLVVNA